MPRWMRVVRGMIGTGLTSALGVGVVGTALGAIGVVAGQVSAIEALQLVGKTSVVAFIVGVVFSGLLALMARGRSLDALSLRLVTALGSGVGLLYFLAISINGAGVWSTADAIGNFAVLTIMGGGLAGGTLLLARRARAALGRGDDAASLREGAGEVQYAQGKVREESRV